MQDLPGDTFSNFNENQPAILVQTPLEHSGGVSRCLVTQTESSGRSLAFETRQIGPTTEYHKINESEDDTGAMKPVTKTNLRHERN